MTFSEALEQYLDARDRLAELARQSGTRAFIRDERESAIAALTEAATRMDELAPSREAT